MDSVVTTSNAPDEPVSTKSKVLETAASMAQVIPQKFYLFFRASSQEAEFHAGKANMRSS